MTLTIGRVRFEEGDAPESWDVDDDGSVSIAGDLARDTLPELLAARAQLVGMVDNPDEPVVPVTWSMDPSVDGYYVVSRVQVSAEAVDYAAKVLPFDLELRPVKAHRLPEVVSTISTVLRQNPHSVSTTAPIHAVPAGSLSWSWMPNGTAQQETRATAPGPSGGDVEYRRVAAADASSVARWFCPPAEWYAGSCAVEQKAGEWVPVVGRQALNHPWRVTNGLVRFTLADSGRLSVEWWDPAGSGWSETVEFGIGRGGGFDFDGWHGAEVTMLAPHQVTLRAQGDRTHGRTTIWLTIRRGSRTIAVTVNTDSVPDHRVQPVPSAAVTDNGGWHAYSGEIGDADLRWLIAVAVEADITTGTGVIEPDSGFVPNWSFGISAWFTGATGDSGSRDQTARDYFAAQAEVVQVG